MSQPIESAPGAAQLAELRAIVAGLSVDGAVSRWWSDNFDRCYLAYEASTNQMPLITDALMGRLLAAIDRLPDGKVASLGSFACGDGEMDALLIRRLRELRPDRQLSFLGLDISDTLCSAARERLDGLIENVTLQTCDITTLKPGDLPPIDIAYIIHGHYYMPDLAGFMDSLLTARGSHTHFGIISAPRAPYNQGYSLFWHADRGHEFWHSDFLLPVLEARNLFPDATRVNGTLDLTRAFAEEFETRYAKDILNFLCHVDLDELPSQAKGAVVAYLDAICTGGPNQRLLAHTCDLFWLLPDSERG